MLSVNSITQDDARHVLYYFGKQEGWQGGSFTQKLLELLSIADLENFQKIENSFPGLAAAHYLADQERNGVEILQQISLGNLSGESK